MRPSWVQVLAPQVLAPQVLAPPPTSSISTCPGCSIGTCPCCSIASTTMLYMSADRGRAGQGRAGQGRAGQGRAGQGRESRAGQEGGGGSARCGGHTKGRANRPACHSGGRWRACQRQRTPAQSPQPAALPPCPRTQQPQPYTRTRTHASKPAPQHPSYPTKVHDLLHPNSTHLGSGARRPPLSAPSAARSASRQTSIRQTPCRSGAPPQCWPAARSWPCRPAGVEGAGEEEGTRGEPWWPRLAAVGRVGLRREGGR